MANVSLLMRKARRRTKEEKAESKARFKEILAIVKKYDIKDGLTPETTVELIQDLGTTFVKLGQIASTHPDMLPVEYCEALGELRTNARPLDFADAKAQVESELGKPLDELFTSFDEKPLGSASIAQVHRAELPTGEIVAVKVQRPGIVETVTNDLAIMERLVEVLDAVNKGKGGLSLKDLVAELVKTSMEELDFANEEANLDRFYANNEPRENVTSPKCYREYSTKDYPQARRSEPPVCEECAAGAPLPGALHAAHVGDDLEMVLGDTQIGVLHARLDADELGANGCVCRILHEDDRLLVYGRRSLPHGIDAGLHPFGSPGERSGAAIQVFQVLGAAANARTNRALFQRHLFRRVSYGYHIVQNLSLVKFNARGGTLIRARHPAGGQAHHLGGQHEPSFSSTRGSFGPTSAA